MRIPALLRCALAVLFVSTAPLMAQLNPKHQDPGGTDLLDVYRTGGAKPEIITTFDNSGSMSAMYFDSRYYPDVNQKWHNNRWTDRTSGGSTNGIKEVNNFYDDDDRIIPVVKTAGSGAGFTVTIEWMRGNGEYQAINHNEVLATGLLVAPDGTVITNAMGGTSAIGWVKLASHVRTTAVDTKGTVAVGDDVTRTVDLPIPWAVFQPTMGAKELSSSPSLKIDAGMPKLLRVHDPVPSNPSSAQDYVVDTLYQNQTSPNYILNSADSDYGRQKIGRFAYTFDYAWWIFFGKDGRVNKYVDNTGDLQSGNAKSNQGTFLGGFMVAGSGNTIVAGVTLGNDGKQAWNNLIPGVTRIQANKQAAISVYVSEQDNVFWAIRWFSTCGTSQNEEGKSTYDSNNQNGSFPDRKLNRLLAPSSSSGPHVSLAALQSEEPGGRTPLTYALMNTLAQMANNNTGVSGSEFNANKTENPIPACRQSYVAIFTDGIANDRSSCSSGSNALGSGDVYATGAAAGNNALKTAIGQVKPGGTHFNVWTIAGVAAHYPYLGAPTYPITGAPTDSGTAGVKFPFAVTSRGAGNAKGTERRIRIFTVGVGLAGDVVDPAGGKGALYLAALYGNPRQDVFSKAAAVPPYDPNDSSRNDRNKNPFFFEADSPDKLIEALQTIIAEIKVASSTLSAPTTPLVGFSLGKQVYVGTFTTVEGAIWKGDLLMSGLLALPNKVTFLDETGAETASLNAANAVWSASNSLQTMGWKPRTLITSRPATPTTLINFSQSVLTKAETGCAAFTDAQFWAQIRYIKGAGAADQLVASSSDAACTNVERSDIMGDIINSTPAVLEFPLAMAPAGLDPGTISTEKKYRVIFVGDNQGWFHAFGEVSGLNSGGVTVGAVKELWAYYPAELLPYVGLYQDSGYGHRYMFDGSPIAYFDDKPASSSTTSGDGIVNGTDVVRIVVGLGKGGRGYYCFSFTGNDPTKPVLSWVRLPDESAGADKTLAQNLMGWATAKPGLGSVKVGSANVDAVFLGGGLSTTTGLEDASRLGTLLGGAKLGRKILALDVLTGSLLKSWDTNTFAGAGAISRGVVPYEFFPNSGQAQRVYFSDQSGNVFALGEPYVSGTFRGDSANINTWGLRRVFQSPAGSPVSSLPAAFRIKDGFPVARSGGAKIKPPAVGLAFGQGDRNDPTDFDTVNPTPGGVTARNRMIVLFDRQDSADVTHGVSYTGKNFDTTGLQLADLADLSTVATSADLRLDPNDASYYLKEKLGYYLNYPAGSAKAVAVGGSAFFYSKTVSEARVLDGVLFFSMFQPVASASAGSCSGAGDTYTFRECDVFAPVWNNASTAASDKAFTVNNDADSKCSGVVSVFANIGGDIANVGTTGILQAGQVKAASTAEEETIGSSGTISTQGAAGNPGTYGQRPRAWRIIR